MSVDKKTLEAIDLCVQKAVNIAMQNWTDRLTTLETARSEMKIKQTELDAKFEELKQCVQNKSIHDAVTSQSSH